MDGSTNSLRGLKNAIYLARQCGATINGIYVMNRTPDKSFRRIGDVEKLQLKFADKFMLKAKTECAKQGIAFTKKLAFGDPGYTIINFAKNNKMNIIVIGARGMGGFKEMFLGSVSNYVLHKSKLPVIVVK